MKKVDVYCTQKPKRHPRSNHTHLHDPHHVMNRNSDIFYLCNVQTLYYVKSYKEILQFAAQISLLIYCAAISTRINNKFTANPIPKEIHAHIFALLEAFIAP